VLLKKGQLVLKQMPLPTKPGSKEVILKSLSVGICGSDVHYWTHGGIGHFQMTGPMILGHETSAEVIEVGEKVFNLKVGDIVAVEPGTPCRCCTDCKIGNYNLCPDMTFHATPPFDGTLTRYFKHPADLCFK
jgi:threonine dehydrogenase-like Zn-dependent dehydrogenase